jgi:hypothetical protein
MPRRTRLAHSRATAAALPEMSPLEEVFSEGDARSLRKLLDEQQNDDAQPLEVERGEPERFLELMGSRGSVDLLDAVLSLSPQEQRLIFQELRVDPSSTPFASILLTSAAAAGSSAFLVHAVKTRGLDVEARTREGVSALEEAARNNQVAALRTLVRECGAAVDACDPRDKCSAAHVAAMAGALEAITVLHAELRANMRLRTRDGKDGVLSLARKGGHLGVVAYLLRSGAVDAETQQQERKPSTVWSVVFANNIATLLLVVALLLCAAAIASATAPRGK